jgi:hypothetical protein
MKDHAN